MTLESIQALDVRHVLAPNAHLYLWVPNALLPDGLAVMQAWGFRYVSNVVWAKHRKDGGPDGRGVGFYFRNVTELLLFGVHGSMRTLAPGRSQVNMIETRKREHSRKPDEQYDLIEACSPGAYLELFARHPRAGWTAWGDEAAADVQPRGRHGRQVAWLVSSGLQRPATCGRHGLLHPARTVTVAGRGYVNAATRARQHRGNPRSVSGR